LVFAVLAVVAAAKNWRADLVEERRRLRIFIVWAVVVYSLAMLAARLNAPHGRLMGLTATLDVTALLAITLVLVSRLLRLGSSNLFPTPTADTSIHSDEIAEPLPPPDPAEERLAKALEQLMSVEHAYRAEDMSLATLATKLNTPEYKLRKLINQRMGHRNFNSFINGLRLDAVRGALVDPKRRDLPVLTLALDAGFQSIGPFNRTFKAATGLTPTEFRKQNSADS
jgi:AraC-like DNA-binding protein